jgi:aminoglycoside phosphotransferase (APT) family kinase protein
MQTDGPVEAVLGALASSSLGPGPWTEFRPARIAGRASVVFVETSNPGAGRSRLVVKQACADWLQDDLASPVPAAQEYQALCRLYAYSQRLGGRIRVPEPVQMLPAIDAFAMEYVPGRSLRELFRLSSVRRPGPILDGLTAAAEFIRWVHTLESLPSRPVDLRAEADAVLSVAEERLHPAGLALPRRVTAVLRQVPSVVVDGRQVWLHGDFGRNNIILADDGSTVGIDVALDSVGPPEEDLVRFVAVMSGAIQFAPGVFAPPVAWLRRRLEAQLLDSYYGTRSHPPLFELRLLHQLALRWLRLRQFARSQRPPVRTVKLGAIEAQIHQLMRESSHRLIQSFSE